MASILVFILMDFSNIGILFYVLSQDTTFNINLQWFIINCGWAAISLCFLAWWVMAQLKLQYSTKLANAFSWILELGYLILASYGWSVFTEDKRLGSSLEKLLMYTIILDYTRSAKLFMLMIVFLTCGPLWVVKVCSELLNREHTVQFVSGNLSKVTLNQL